MQREEEPIYVKRGRLFRDCIRSDRFGEAVALKTVCAAAKEPVPYEKQLKTAKNKRTKESSGFLHGIR